MIQEASEGGAASGKGEAKKEKVDAEDRGAEKRSYEKGEKEVYSGEP